MGSSADKDKSIKLCESRVPLSNIGSFKCYKLSKGHPTSSAEAETAEVGRIFIRINRLESELLDSMPSQAALNYFPLCKVLDASHPLYRHLYVDVKASPDGLSFYNGGLPGPSCGELAIDRYANVEWQVLSGSNIFGDKLSVCCTGHLVVSDLRVIFLPYEVSPGISSSMGSYHNACSNAQWMDRVALDRNSRSFSQEEMLTWHRYTYQVLQIETYCLVAPVGNPGLQAPGKDSSRVEFIVRKKIGSGRSSKVFESASGDKSTEINLQQLNDEMYRSGLDTESLDPSLWCNRVLDYITYEMREDRMWLRWSRYMKATCTSLFSSEREHLRKNKQKIELETDYRRLHVQDTNWKFSNLNSSYQMCPTYPQLLVFPGDLNDDELMGAAFQRSIGRLPTLVWMHPFSKAPLCRASQPKAGLSGTSIEFDKKLCLSIKASCPTQLPLRIADARPKMNANANAMQGKGFENVSFLGGSSVVAIVFMDIENIHVMRSSLYKLRENLLSGNLAMSDAASGGINLNMNSGGSSSTGGWLGHVASVLKGAVGICDSMMMGHPMLVHCSDGWDRTAQLTALAQLMLDPYYRTVEGFICLINKEWCSFGHKFEDRMGRTSHKETSPIFLQFLDCVYQLLGQYPNQFEFTSHLLLLLAQALYSGYFVSFRGNCEKERIQLMKKAAFFEEMTYPDDFEFSSIIYYVYIIMRCPNLSAMMINRCYAPPPARNKLLYYIRPRTGALDMELWRDGLTGINSCLLGVSDVSAYHSPSILQVSARDSLLLSRYFAYSDLHEGSLPANCRDRLEVLRPIDATTLTYSTPQGQFIRGKFIDSLFHNPDPAPVLRKDEGKTVSSAALILQLWYRAINGVRKCMASMGKEFCEKNIVKHSSSIAHRSMRNIKSWRIGGGGGAGGRDWNREKILWRGLFIFYHSYLRSTYRDKRTLTMTRCKFMQTIVDDVVEEALVMALRLARYVYVPVIPVGQPDLPFGLSAQSVDDLIDGSSGATNAVQSCNSTDVPVSTPSSASSKKVKKSLTSRLMKGFNSYVSGSGRALSSESSSSPAPVSPGPSSPPTALMKVRDKEDDAVVDDDREDDEAAIAMRNNIAGKDETGEVHLLPPVSQSNPNPNIGEQRRGSALVDMAEIYESEDIAAFIDPNYCDQQTNAKSVV
eukprot:gene30928-40253_t